MLMVILSAVCITNGAWGMGTVQAFAGEEQIAVQPSSGEGQQTEDKSRFYKDITSPSLASDSSVLNFLKENKEITGLTDPQTNLKLIDKKQDKIDQTHLLYQQQYQGIPVYGKYMRVHLDENKQVQEVASRTEPEKAVMPDQLTASISASQAVNILKQWIEDQEGTEISWDSADAGQQVLRAPGPTAKLIIYPGDQGYRLAYEVNVTYLKPHPGKWTAYVDAGNGSIMDEYSTSYQARSLNPSNMTTGVSTGYNGDSKSLNIYKEPSSGKYQLLDITKPMWQMYTDTDRGVFTYGYGGTDSFGKIYYENIESSSTAFSDRQAVDAHFNAGKVYDYYYTKLGRNSVDAQGSPIRSIVHIPDLWSATNQGGAWDNAAWFGGYMLYGDGSGSSRGGFDCLSCGLDVVAHEITHGVNEKSANLEYQNQSGALNESFSDLFGALIESNYDSADTKWWLIGEDLRQDRRALRNMRNPGDSSVLSPQPAHMSDYVYLPNDSTHDNGGVHTNSGIPNRAGYLMVANLEPLLGTAGAKNAVASMAYDVLTNYLNATSNFVDAANGYESAAQNYVKAHSELQYSRQQIIQAVTSAWNSVGIQTADTAAPAFTQGYPRIGTVTDVSAEVVLNVDEASKVYAKVQPAADPAPTLGDLKMAASQSASAYQDLTLTFSNLNPQTSYVVYLAAYDTTGNVSSAPVKVSFVTKQQVKPADTTAPVFANGYPKASAVTDNSLHVLVKTDENAAIYALPVPADQSKPTREALQQLAPTIVAAGQEADLYFDKLSPDQDYIIYFLAKDNAGNTQTSLTEVPVHTAAQYAGEPVLTLLNPVIQEDLSNDGTVSATQSLYVDHGTFVQDITGGVVLEGLPAGLGYEAVRSSDQLVLIRLTGKALRHTHADDTVVTVKVKSGYITGVASEMTAGIFTLDFMDPVTVPADPPGGGSGGTGSGDGSGGSVPGGSTDGGSGGGGIPGGSTDGGSGGGSGGGTSGGSTGGGGSGGGGVPALPEQPDEAAGQGSFNDTAPGFEYVPASDEVKSTRQEGQEQAVLNVTADIASSAVGRMSSADKVWLIRLDHEADAWKVTYPLSVLRNAPAISGAGIKLSTSAGSFTLPLSVLKAGMVTARTGTSAEGWRVEITVKRADAAGHAQWSQAVSRSAAGNLLQPVHFEAALTNNVERVALQDFGRAYAARTLRLPAGLPQNWTAVTLGPDGELLFVPAVKVKEDGYDAVQIMTTHTSLYGIVAASKSFPDLNSHWSRADVELLASKLLVKGVSASRFEPNRQVTRAEFATLLVRALGLSLTQNQTSFKDVKPGAWYAAPIESAYQSGLIRGTGANQFKPDAPVTRQEMAAMLGSAMDLLGRQKPDSGSGIAIFKDRDTVAPWAASSVDTAVRAGLLQGSGGLFRPAAPSTRAEATVVLKRLLVFGQLMTK
ncbi:M4 family metallopeptidase [Paenibacillus sp. YPG26]|uniref:M4 family metallopeptidase n=1 Tax=Paenibacillus sp. YPG26 TaxID=2878915 RepID=UPI00203A629F|nr:M4 family metallopeptidase [Paenibacillus sp. YPG26]USB33578.1 M4 family metallopeptidase [Paenibacillus sp. YPG26]